MLNRIRSLAGCSGAAWLLCIAGLVALGCQGASPFLAAQFATNIGPFVGAVGGGSTTSSAPSGNTNTPVDSVCDLQSNLRNIQVSIINEAQQQVRFSMTFMVSAGTGGFVDCAEEVTRYEQAGYRDACTPGTCATVSVGCDTISLNSGTRLLRLDFGINQGVIATLPAAPSTGTSFPQRQLTLGNGSADIPVPEVIIFGSDDPNFICVGGDLTTQRAASSIRPHRQPNCRSASRPRPFVFRARWQTSNSAQPQSGGLIRRRATEPLHLSSFRRAGRSSRRSWTGRPMLLPTHATKRFGV